MKKIHIQIQIEERTVETIISQLNRFIRCTRYFMIVIVTYVVWESFQIFNSIYQITTEKAMQISGTIYILWFIFYVCLAVYFLYLSEQYYKILGYNKRIIYWERLFYSVIFFLFLISCLRYFIFDAVFLIYNGKELDSVRSERLKQLQIWTGYVSELMPVFFGLGMIRIVY